MTDADEVVIEALPDDVLDPTLLHDGVNTALQLIQGNDRDPLTDVNRELARLEQERARLVSAIANGGELAGLVVALRTRETRRTELEAQRSAIASRRHFSAAESGRVRDELIALA